jgi:hypothetical protein
LPEEEEKQTVQEYGLLAGRIQTGLLREFIGLLESLPKSRVVSYGRRKMRMG